MNLQWFKKKKEWEREKERKREKEGRKRERRRKKGRRETKEQMHQMAIWSRQCSQGWACDEAEHQRMHLTASLTGRHRPPTSAHALRPPSLTGRQRAPTSAHALRPHRLLGGNSFPFVHYVAITKWSSYLHGNRLSRNKGSLEQAFLWFLPGRRVFTKNYWPWDFPSATVADIPRSQSRGPGLDLVWERDPTCHNWVCMHDEDPTQLNK